jgi:hypothetical protein
MQNGKRLMTVAAAMVAVILVLWVTNRAVTPIEATLEDVRAEARAGGYQLVDTETLAQWRQQGKEMLLVDTRQDWEYRAGHIEGSLNFPMEPTWWSRWSKKDDLAGFLGPDKDKLLVFY